jgi:uridine kinase
MEHPLHKTIIIGIAGPSGSGKSVMASTIVKELGSNQVVVISEDSYYKDLKDLPIAVRAQQNFDHPESLDHALLITHLKTLQQGQPVRVPEYDHAQHIRLSSTQRIHNHKILVLEGILLFVEPALRALMDIRIFVDAPLDICFIRRLQRDIQERSRNTECVIKQYQETVRPMYLQFIEPSKRYADIIIPNGGKNRIAIDVIKAKMNELLNKTVKQ